MPSTHVITDTSAFFSQLGPFFAQFGRKSACIRDFITDTWGLVVSWHPISQAEPCSFLSR